MAVAVGVDVAVAVAVAVAVGDGVALGVAVADAVAATGADRSGATKPGAGGPPMEDPVAAGVDIGVACRRVVEVDLLDITARDARGEDAAAASTRPTVKDAGGIRTVPACSGPAGASASSRASKAERAKTPCNAVLCR